MTEQIPLVIAFLAVAPLISAGLRAEGLGLIGSIGQAFSGASAWLARLAWTLTKGSVTMSDSVLSAPRLSDGEHGQEPKVRRILLVIGVLLTAPVCVGLVVSDFDINKLKFAPWFGLSAGSAPVLPLETLAGALWALVVLAWGSAAFDAAGLLPLAPWHWLRPRPRRCLATLFFVMLLLSFVAAMLFFEITQAVVERRQTLIPGASTIFNLMFALLLHSSVVVTGWSLPLLLWVVVLALVGACCLLSLVIWVLMALLTRGLEDFTVIVLRSVEVLARLGRLIWNAFAHSPLGQWWGVSPLDEPTPWRWVRNDVCGPLWGNSEGMVGLVFEQPAAEARFHLLPEGDV